MARPAFACLNRESRVSRAPREDGVRGERTDPRPPSSGDGQNDFLHRYHVTLRTLARPRARGTRLILRPSLGPLSGVNADGNVFETNARTLYCVNQFTNLLFSFAIGTDFPDNVSSILSMLLCEITQHSTCPAFVNPRFTGNSTLGSIISIKLHLRLYKSQNSLWPLLGCVYAIVWRRLLCDLPLYVAGRFVPLGSARCSYLTRIFCGSRRDRVMCRGSYTLNRYAALRASLRV